MCIPESSASCQCWPCFFDTTQYSFVGPIASLLASTLLPSVIQQQAMSTVRSCQEAPVGFYTDGLSGVTQCPPRESTRHTQSTSVSQCGCAGGFKVNAMPEIVNGGRCVPCVLDEVCTADSAGVVGSCTQLYKEVPNRKNDACVCQAGFFDEMATRQGAMRCAPCP